MLKVHKQQGDTIIEVIVAFAIFSMLAVGGLSLMNQGTATAQRTLEITLVRQQIDAQADILRAINREVVSGVASDDFKSKWSEIITAAAPAGVGTGEINFVNFDNISDPQNCKKPPEVDELAFFVSTSFGTVTEIKVTKAKATASATQFKAATTYAKIQKDGNVVNSEGIWVVAVKGVNFYDFHIRACWISPGQGTPMRLGTIVRLYYEA